uniref:BED-type domain-containing protein n=1 Tax=Ditylenchus dipsaci TaxID=166011 RepID=A0A915DY73_9BILA
MSLDRKLHWSWQFFDESEEEIDGKTVAVTHCKFCTQRYRDNATKIDEAPHRTVSKDRTGSAQYYQNAG